MTKLGRAWLLSLLPNALRHGNQVSSVTLATKGTSLQFQKDSKLVQIPEEVLLLIVDHLEKAAIVRLIRTCRYFHDLLEGTLYREIRPIYPYPYTLYINLFRTLEKRPDLIPCIRSYCGPLLPPTIPAPPPLPKRRFLDKLRKRKAAGSGFHLPLAETERSKFAVSIFTNATNIEDFSFGDFSLRASDPRFELITAAISKMPLKRLSLWHCDQVLQVLRDQPELEELVLGGDCPEIEQLEKTDIPKLRYFVGNFQEAARIVPGRPVEELRFLPGQNFDEKFFSKFALSSRSITKFSGHMYHPWKAEAARTAFRVIARNLPGVERLTLVVGGSISGQVILDEIPALRSLKSLALHDAHLAAVPIHDFEYIQRPAIVAKNWDNLIVRLKELCSVLVEVRYTSSLFCGCCQMVVN